MLNGDRLTDKFQGEPKFVLDFWERAQKGMADEVDDTIFKFTITAEDVAKYPELKPGMRLFLTESTDGFVFHELLPPKRSN
jgi:hypothetical protein